ncbi:MAG: NAD(P)-dependent oxidoreductase [Glaciihabitans sp.]|nr:NAD(P)-dependent oxidoreductase [Glaciihabitans sp.]
MTVLIAGCGDLGTEAGLRFAARGHRVVGVRRSIDRLPGLIEGQSVDLRRNRPVVPVDTSVVVIALTAGQRTAEAYRETYLRGLGNVLDGINESGANPRRVILVSSTAVYDVADGSWVDETTPATSDSPTAAVLRETEDLLRERAPGAVVLRLGGIYGPGRERLINQVREGSARIPASSLFTNRIHRDDAAAAIVHLALTDNEVGPLYLGVDNEPTQLGEVLGFLAGELGADIPQQGNENSREQGGDKRCSNAALRATGFEPVYPTFREGYRAVLAGVGTQHP